MNVPQSPRWIHINTKSAPLFLDAIGHTITNIEICKDENFPDGMCRLSIEVRDDRLKPVNPGEVPSVVGRQHGIAIPQNYNMRQTVDLLSCKIGKRLKRIFQSQPQSDVVVLEFERD